MSCFRPIFRNCTFLTDFEPFFLLHGQKTKSAQKHAKGYSNKKVEEKKPALELNFLSKYDRGGSYN